MRNETDLTVDELAALARNAATQLSPLLSVTVLRLISEVQRRRSNERDPSRTFESTQSVPERGPSRTFESTQSVPERAPSRSFESTQRVPPQQPTRVRARVSSYVLYGLPETTDDAPAFDVAYDEDVSDHAAFAVNCIGISSDGNGGADWVVNDIEIDGRSQLLQKDLPGALFGERGIMSGDATTSFKFEGLDVVEPGRALALIVTYVGSNPEGAPFHAWAFGTRPPQ